MNAQYFPVSCAFDVSHLTNFPLKNLEMKKLLLCARNCVFTNISWKRSAKTIRNSYFYPINYYLG